MVNIYEEKKIIEIYEYYKPLFKELQVCVFLIHSHIPSVHVEYGSLIWHSRELIHGFPNDTGSALSAELSSAVSSNKLIGAAIKSNGTRSFYHYYYVPLLPLLNWILPVGLMICSQWSLSFEIWKPFLQTQIESLSVVLLDDSLQYESRVTASQSSDVSHRFPRSDKDFQSNNYIRKSFSTYSYSLGKHRLSSVLWNSLGQRHLPYILGIMYLQYVYLSPR